MGRRALAEVRLNLLRAALFPITYLSTTASLTVVIIGVGVLVDPAAAADLALAQGALLATFIAVSANLRNLIVQRTQTVPADDLLAARTLMLPVLCIAAYFLSVEIARVPVALAAVVILRRSCEWLAEVRLNLLELEGDRRTAVLNVAAQGLTTALVIAAYALFPRGQLPAMALWALAPLVVAPRISFGAAGFRTRRLAATLRTLLPYAGSTVIVGLSMYVLRLIIVTATEREVAGLILTGIAIGSVAGTVFATVLGPTIALRSPGYGQTRTYRLVLAALVVAGALCCAFALHSTLWLATGLSLIGSAVMIQAQRMRLRMFEERSADELFAADVLRCLALLVVVLTVAYLSRPAALAGAYLLDATLTWVFYRAAARPWLDALAPSRRAENWVCAALAFLIVFPLFFQLKGAIYQSALAMNDSGGSVTNVPFPVSMLACFGGILLLGRYRHASLAMATLFVFFVCLVLTTIVAAGGPVGYNAQKLVLMIQFMVPPFALVLGQILLPRPGAGVALRVMTQVAVAVAAAQLVVTFFFTDEALLTHDFFLFSIYQHRQFVPVVFVGAFLLGLYSLWGTDHRRPLLAVGAACMAVYVVHSFSTLALALLVAGALALAALFRGRERAGLLAFLTVAVIAAAFVNVRTSPYFREKYELGFQDRTPVHAAVIVGAQTRLPENVAHRLDDWVLYGKGVLDSPKLGTFGHPLPFDRAVATSAHNFYLDLAYNFGLLSLLPLAGLLAYTCVLVVRQRRAVLGDPALAGMVLVLLFLLVADSNLKVTLRQPYPGIFAYFLWGMVLSRLLPREPARDGRR